MIGISLLHQVSPFSWKEDTLAVRYQNGQNVEPVGGKSPTKNLENVSLVCKDEMSRGIISNNLELYAYMHIYLKI